MEKHEEMGSEVAAQNEANQELLEEQVENDLTTALDRKDRDAVTTLLEEAHPIDVAIALEEVSDSDILFLNSLVTAEQLAEIVEQAEEDLQIRIMKLLDLDRILAVFQFMSKDDIVDILGNMPVNRRKELLKLMKSGDQTVIRNLLGYSETSAGGIMTTEFISMRNTLTVSQALEKVKEIAPKTEEINILYITNEKKQLVGTVSLRELLVAQNYDTLQDIMEDNVISVEPETDQEDVARSSQNTTCTPFRLSINGWASSASSPLMISSMSLKKKIRKTCSNWAVSTRKKMWTVLPWNRSICGCPGSLSIS